MFLAVDIGNSNIKFGVFDGEQLHSKFSIPTGRESSAADLRKAIGANIDLPISEALVCSVVPQINDSIHEFFLTELGIKPVFVTNDFDFGLTINYEPISDVGTDRLVNSFAASEKYGVPCIVCSFGTATTIDVVNEKREFLGGLIAPGFVTMARALRLNTARLPEVEIVEPANIIGNTTETSIQSGLFYSQIGLIEAAVAKIRKETGDNPGVITTGGFAAMIAENTDQIDVVDENLLLDGLRLLSQKKISQKSVETLAFSGPVSPASKAYAIIIDVDSGKARPKNEILTGKP